MRDFDTEIWALIKPEYERLLTERPFSKEDAPSGVAMPSGTRFAEHMASKKELRNVTGNIAYTPPKSVSLAGEVITMEKAERAARFLFWDQGADCPRAPANWPPNCNVPIALLSPAVPDKGQYRRNGMDVVVVGFWWAFSQAIKRQKAEYTAANIDTTVGFSSLARHAIFDFTLFDSEEAITVHSFQLVENIEFMRDINGFVGTRKMLVVSAAFDMLKRKAGGTAPDNNKIAAYLRSSINWSDPKKTPSANTVRDLLSLKKHLLKNVKAMECIQIAEVLYGRDTLFDQYSKLIIICNKSKGATDLAYIMEGLVASMQRTTPAGECPDVPSNVELQAKNSDIHVWQLVRSCMARLFPEGKWNELASIVAAMQRPLEVNTVVDQLRGAPKSLQAAYRMCKDMINRSNPEFVALVHGLLSNTPTGSIDVEKHIFKTAFRDLWDEAGDGVVAPAGPTQIVACETGETRNEKKCSGEPD